MARNWLPTAQEFEHTRGAPLMFRHAAQHRRRVVIILDALVTLTSLLAASWLRTEWTGGPVPLVAVLGVFPAVLGPLVFLLARFGGYRSPGTLSALDIVRSVTSAVAVGLMFFLSLMFVLKFQHLSRLFVVAFGALAASGFVATRAVLWWRHRSAFRGDGRRERVLIVGTGRRAQHLASTLLGRADVACEIVGFVDPDVHRVGQSILGAPVLGTLGDFGGIVRSTVVDEVLMALPRGMIEEMDKIVRTCEEEGVRVRMMADLFPVSSDRVTLDRLAGIPLLTFDAVPQDEWRLLVKRGIDVLLAGGLLIALMPVMLLIGLAIRIESAGPILFVHERIGLNKRKFRFIKFRSMVADAEERQAALEHLNEVEGPVFKIRQDPRVTRVGRVLRRTSLDELPQLFNVLTGDMSLVGPRPLPRRDVDLFDPGVQRRRFSVKPGLTCLWQVSGRSNVPFAKWLELDLWYIGNWSLALDLKILLRTVPAVLRGTGAS